LGTDFEGIAKDPSTLRACCVLLAIVFCSGLVPIRARPGRKDAHDDPGNALVPRDRAEGRAASGRRAGGRTRSAPEDVDLYGRFKAKIDLSVLDRPAANANAKLIDVTAITPTKAGEGRRRHPFRSRRASDTSARNRCSASERPRSARCSDQGGATGGGYAQVVRWRT